jgi:hypothetical protein
MHVPMLAEVLARGVEHHRDPDLAPEPLEIPTTSLQGVRGRLKKGGRAVVNPLDHTGAHQGLSGPAVIR